MTVFCIFPATAATFIGTPGADKTSVGVAVAILLEGELPATLRAIILQYSGTVLVSPEIIHGEVMLFICVVGGLEVP